MEQQAFLDIEVALQKDPDGHYKHALLEEFAREAQAIRRALERGTAPDEYQRLSKLLQALDSARDVVEAMWARFQAASAVAA